MSDSPTGRPARPIILAPMDVPGKPDSLPAIRRDLVKVLDRLNAMADNADRMRRAVEAGDADEMQRCVEEQRSEP